MLNGSDFNDSDLESFLNFDTHGNFIRYSFLLKESKLKLSDDPLTCIDYFMDLYNSKNDLKILNLLTLLIQNFYTKLALERTNFDEYVSSSGTTNTITADLDVDQVKFSIGKAF